MFTSGHMYNAIRHTPYTQSNGQGGFNYIAAGFQNQFGIETQIIASICTASFKQANRRRIIGVLHNCSSAQSTYDRRSYSSIHCHMGVGYWDTFHILFLDLCLSSQEWRVSIQITPLNRIHININRIFNKLIF